MATLPASNSSQANRNLLKVTPKELIFAPPFNRVITNVLRLQNTNPDASVAYKVKTTAPQRYCVRPNTGVIPPLDSAEISVSVSLANAKEQLPVEGKDKFQIQAVKVTHSYNDIKEVWSKASEDDVKKQKLKAIFLLPSPSSLTSNTPSNNTPITIELTTPQPTTSNTPPSTLTLSTPPSTPNPIPHTPSSSVASSLLMESSLTSSLFDSHTAPSSTFSSFSTLPSEFIQQHHHHQQQQQQQPIINNVQTPQTVIVDPQPGMRKIIDEMNEKLSTVSNERDSLFKQILLLNQQISQIKEISLHQKEVEETSPLRHRNTTQPTIHTTTTQQASITSSFIRDPTIALTYSFRGFPVIIVHKGEEVQFLLLIFIVFLVSFLLGLML